MCVCICVHRCVHVCVGMWYMCAHVYWYVVCVLLYVCLDCIYVYVGISVHVLAYMYTYVYWHVGCVCCYVYACVLSYVCVHTTVHLRPEKVREPFNVFLFPT